MPLTDAEIRHTKPAGPSRRRTLAWTAGALGAAVFGVLPNFEMFQATQAERGTGDIGVLNYAYGLERLEAAF